MFIRVRGATPGDPLHEFDVPVARVKRHPDLYEVIDPKPVADPRPASAIPGTVPKKKSAPAKKRAAREDLVKPTAPEGADS